MIILVYRVSRKYRCASATGMTAGEGVKYLSFLLRVGGFPSHFLLDVQVRGRRGISIHFNLGCYCWVYIGCSINMGTQKVSWNDGVI